MKVYLVCKVWHEQDRDELFKTNYYLEGVDSVWGSKQEAQKYCDQKNPPAGQPVDYMIWRPYEIQGTQSDGGKVHLACCVELVEDDGKLSDKFHHVDSIWNNLKEAEEYCDKANKQKPSYVSGPVQMLKIWDQVEVQGSSKADIKELS